MQEKDKSSTTIVAGSLVRKIHLALLAILQLVMAGELVFLIARERWLHVFLVAGMMVAFLVPTLARRNGRASIPAGIQIFVILFIFASLFLGEVRDYYERVWWWDLALHTSAGLLLGFLGFFIVYLLSADEAVDVHMRPSFMALFAFFFAIGLGTLWEIFEFGMDWIFGLTMQKSMLGDASGLTDTMWDMIVNAAGAAAVSLAGWRYLLYNRRNRVADRIGRFVRWRARHSRRMRAREM